MATCSWTRSGTEHHILLEEVEPVSAIEADTKIDRKKETKEARERREETKDDGVEGKGGRAEDINTGEESEMKRSMHRECTPQGP